MEEEILLKIKSLGIGEIERITVDILNNINLKNKKFVLMLEKRNETKKTVKKR